MIIFFPGDCWFVAGAACLAVDNQKLFHRCVPHEQQFDEDYAGKIETVQIN